MRTTCTAIAAAEPLTVDCVTERSGLKFIAAHSSRKPQAVSRCGVPQDERHANATLSDALAAERERSSHAAAAAAGAAGAYRGSCGVSMGTASPHRNRMALSGLDGSGIALSGIHSRRGRRDAPMTTAAVWL